MNITSMIPNPWHILAAVVLCVGAYLWGRHDGSALEEAAQLRDEKVAQVAYESAQKAAAEAIAGIEVKNTTIRQTVEREIREKPVYTDCRIPVDGLRLINAALTGRAESVGSSKLPRLDATQ